MYWCLLTVIDLGPINITHSETGLTSGGLELDVKLTYSPSGLITPGTELILQFPTDVATEVEDNVEVWGTVDVTSAQESSLYLEILPT